MPPPPPLSRRHPRRRQHRIHPRPVLVAGRALPAARRVYHPEPACGRAPLPDARHHHRPAFRPAHRRRRRGHLASQRQRQVRLPGPGAPDGQQPPRQVPCRRRRPLRALLLPSDRLLAADAGAAYRLLRLMDRSPMRPAHIHVMVMHPDFRTCTTQLYPRDDPWVTRDSVFAVKDDLVVDFKPLDGDAQAELELEYNVVLSPRSSSSSGSGSGS